MKLRPIAFAAVLMSLLCACGKETAMNYLSFDESSASLLKGETMTLNLYVQKGLDGTREKYDVLSNPLGVTFTSSLPAKVTVSELGLVTANGTGTAVVTASADGCGSAKCQVTVTSPAEVAPELTVGSYNLWVHGTGTGEYAWDLRKSILAKSIIDNGFDIFAFQEADATIRSELPGLVKSAGRTFEWWFVCRDNQTATSGEAVGIAYDPEIFTMSDQHWFWISETPDVCSYGWDETSYHRVCGTATFTLKETGAKFMVMATHGPLGDKASDSCGSLFVERAKQYNPDNLPIFLIGDMNATPGSALSNTFRTWWSDPVFELDADKKTGPLGTFNGHSISRNMENETYRIDYIYYRGTTSHLWVRSYSVNDTKYTTTASMYPSDHLPVSLKVKVY